MPIPSNVSARRNAHNPTWCF
ncbi:MAG: hypothetical protein ACOH1J_03845 [Microbacteriaceae bacterium]